MKLTEEILIYASFLILILYVVAFFVERRTRNVIKLHIMQIALLVVIFAIWIAHIVIDIKLNQFSWLSLCAIVAISVLVFYSISTVREEIKNKKYDDTNRY